ncbi:ATP-binding protein [Actimicrobium sp. CCC2.4]|uniref:ATP-binding protein n=1 Tax=Actimicrobium sp. CCC2.4 TaxID=3048606 RepID=UPI002AC9CBFC|nr:ATP-binding protein [Actimicrobium sp. CCC2.4]MEB0135386.1 ATP-binding protein [Actimicrobium sp. CCC2.4]WPX32439.1 ATP-binding protein [Actimicrobium sp. CCC2.4]
MIPTTSLPFPYSAKRHGASLAQCDDEPVSTPGCIQSHGMLLAMDPVALIVTQVSDNCAQWTARPVAQVLGAALADVLGMAVAQRIARLIGIGGLEGNPTYAMTERVPGMPADTEPLDISVHLAGGVLIVELEPTGRDRRGPLSERDYYSRVKSTMARLRASPSLASFCQAIAEEVRSTTGLDRAMVYRFHADDSGEIVADSHRPDLHTWLGLRYPASDIPKPAREIFKQIGVRPLPDARGELCELVPLLDPASGAPLDMTHCALRGASAMYTEYLTNMGVAATLTMPILRDNVLWGLVVCHHYTPTVMPYHQRAAAEFIGQVASLEITGAETREHAQYQARIDAVHHGVMTRAATRGELTALMEAFDASDRSGLLDGIDAGGIALRHHDQWLTSGQTPSTLQLQSLAGWVRQQLAREGNGAQLVVTDALGSLFAPAAQYADVASGLLAIAVSRSLQGDLLFWFRPEQKQVFNWSGNPYDKPTVTGPHGARLTPRRSFDLWQEEVRGRAMPWKPVEIDGAQKLRQWIADMVIGRAEQLDKTNSDLVRSNDELDAFAYVAGHDLKEPLRGIYKNAYQLKEEVDAGRLLGDAGSEHLGTVMRLTLRMDNLLDALLNYARIGRIGLDYEEVDLGAVVAEALEMLGSRLAVSGLEVRIPRPMPILACDRIRVREVFANLISNALKYNDKPAPWLEIGYLDHDGTTPLVFFVRDNGIGIESRHCDRVFQIFKRLHPRDAYGGGAGAGLAVVRKLVEQHHGRIWFDAEPGVGATFYFTLKAPGLAAPAQVHAHG